MKIRLLVLAFLSAALFSCKDDDISSLSRDTDQDGILNQVDNCPEVANADQADADGDGIGDVCDDVNDVDFDNDGILNGEDNCPNAANSDQADVDGDGIGDVCDEVNDIDIDNDGILNEEDNCPDTPNPDQIDVDEDGIGDACDDEILRLTPCENGFADIFPCDGYDLVSWLDLEALGDVGNGNDVWGWTDPASGREFVLMGTNISTVFVEITQADQPVIVGILPAAAGSRIWRDIKVYNNHAYIVSESPGHGMQVFDLTRLIDAAPNTTFTSDFDYDEFSTCHNIVINENGQPYAYAVGTNTFGGGPHIIDLSDPANPTFSVGFQSDEFNAYTHDAQVVTYSGPDPDYQGREIYIGANGSTENDDVIVVLDVTDKNDIQVISTIQYENMGYAHQAWLTTDQKYLLLGDEFDEGDIGFNTRTIVFDFSDLDNPVYQSTYFGPTPAIDHNGYTDDDTFYLANYTAGVRFIDISDINNIHENGFFDTYPESDNASFNGVWSIYPYFESGFVAISDFNRGLFIVRKQ